MRKTVGKYGVLAAGLMSALMIGPYLVMDVGALVAGSAWIEVVGYAAILAAMTLVFFAIREHRERNLGGRLRFRTGLLLGLSVTTVAALLFGLATVLLYAWLGPEQTDALMQAYVERSGGGTDYESQRALWLNPWFQGAVMAATALPVGVIVSLVSAALLRR